MSLAIAISITAVVTFALTIFVVKGPIPFVDNGSVAFTAADEKAQALLAEQIFPKYGIKPRFRVDSPVGIKRAIMSDLSIINVVAKAMSEKMGHPVAAKIFRTGNPEASAKEDAQFLSDAGYPTEVLGQLDTSLPDGRMFFISSEALPGIVLVYRRHIFAMGEGKPPKYHKVLAK